MGALIGEGPNIAAENRSEIGNESVKMKLVTVPLDIIIRQGISV